MVELGVFDDFLGDFNYSCKCNDVVVEDEGWYLLVVIEEDCVILYLEEEEWLFKCLVFCEWLLLWYYG